jgi:hypothetical protein
MIYKADWLSFFTVLTFMCIMLPARATKGYITAVPAPNSSGLIVVAKDKKVTFTIHAGNDTTGASTATFVNGTPPNTNSVTGSIDVTFGTNADGHTNLCTFNMVTKGSTSETCSTNPPIKFNVVVPKVTMSGSSPIKVGITANGHDRKQPFSANIEPASAVSLITLYGDAKITLSDFKPGDGEMDFKMVGVTASSTAGDSSIMAKITASGDVLSDASFPVSVVIPGAVGTPHPTYDSDVTGVNVALDATMLC